MNCAKERKVFNSRPIFYGFLAMLLAISVTRYLFAGNLKYIILTVGILSAFVVYCLWCKKIVIMFVTLAFFAFGCGWFYLGVFTFQGTQHQGICEIVGRISDDVTYSSYGNRAYVVLDDVTIDGTKDKNIALTIKISSENDFAIGDKISFQATVQNIQLFELGKFNTSAYRDKTAYSAEAKIDDVSTLGNKLKVDEKVRAYVKEKLYKNMGNDQGAVAFAVLFGDKSGVKDDVYDAYKTAGIIHLLTVSGLHVGFLIALLGFVMNKLKVNRVVNLLICFAVIGSYAYLCGFTPSVLRAGIMGLLLLATRLSGKCYDGLNTLGLSGLCILFFSPLSGLDTGFLMSYFCVMGIFVVSPWLAKLLSKVFPKRLAESIAISIGAQIGILPFAATMYSNLNFLTFFVNLIVIPIFSALYPFLFVSTFLVCVMPFLGFLLKICGVVLGFVYDFASFYGKSKLVTDLEPFNIIVLTLVAILLFLVSRYFMSTKKTRIICCSVLFAFACVAGVMSNVSFSTSNTSVTICENVILLTSQSGESAIIDSDSYSFNKTLLENCGLKAVETMFVLQDSTILFDSATKIGVNNIVRCDSGQGYDEEQLVETDTYNRVGDFSFAYKSYKNRLLGLEISFDGVKIFVLRELKQSEEALETVANESYDIAILGKYDDYANLFINTKYLVGDAENEHINFSYERYGNVSCKIKNQKFSWRCID